MGTFGEGGEGKRENKQGGGREGEREG